MLNKTQNNNLLENPKISNNLLLNDLLDNNKNNNLLNITNNITNKAQPKNILSSIEIYETTDSSIASQIQNIRDSWLQNEQDLLQHQAMGAFRCNCPSCCSGILPSNFVEESSTVSASETITTSTLEFNKIEALLSSYQWNNSNTITYSFYEDDIFKGAYYGSEKNVREVSNKVKDSVREIMGWLETVVEIDFVEVAETNSSTYGQIRYMLSDSPSYAWAYYPNNFWDIGGDVHLRASYESKGDTNGFQNDPGKHGYMTLIHETLHALGLKHPQDGSLNLPTNDDNTAHTVMSYKFTGNSAGTAMPYDIAALQYLYGAKAHNTSNDTYTFGKTTDVWIVNGKTVLESPHRFKQTIWDSGGIDTLDFSQLSFNDSGYRFDLNPGGWLIANNVNRQNTNQGNYYNYGTSIAFDVTIENIIASSSSDYIVANSAANIFGGYESGIDAGDDTLVNTNAADILDLSGYSASEITQTQKNNDLIIDLKDSGSVTVKNYFAAATNNRLQIQLQEDVSTTEIFETDVTDEPINNVTIGEVGKIEAVNHNLQTIELQGNYTNPVVFAQPLSHNGGHTAIIRVTDIQSDSISFYVQEAEHLDGKHTNESFSYLVLEAGNWQLADGTLIEVGSFTSNANVGNQWETVNFQNNFTETPVVLSQVQTTNNSEFIRTRQDNTSNDGFKVALEKEESLKNTQYQQDTIGWLAISSGEGTWDGNSYQAINTGDVVTHDWFNLDLSSSFTETPQLLASIATYDGGDSAGLRSKEITGANGSTIALKIEEDQSKDPEVKHTTEEINLFAIQGTGLLTAQASNLTADNFALAENVEFGITDDSFGLDSIADI